MKRTVAPIKVCQTIRPLIYSLPSWHIHRRPE